MQATEYLKENVHSPEKNIQDALNMIMDNIKRADHIIRTLSDFVRITELKLESQDIKLAIIRSLDLIKPRVKLENIKIVKEFKKNFPEVLLDSSKIEQVFANLFLNAVQAMPDGGTIFIRGYTKKLDKLENRVGRRASDYFKLGEKAAIIEIEDTGIGISRENLQKLYTPFFTTKGPKGGAGLGLSVTKNIIEMHTGMIKVQSQENKGTKFTITLKIHGGK
jgi:signal transduction histidine kinase